MFTNMYQYIYISVLYIYARKIPAYVHKRVIYISANKMSVCPQKGPICIRKRDLHTSVLKKYLHVSARSRKSNLVLKREKKRQLQTDRTRERKQGKQEGGEGERENTTQVTSLNRFRWLQLVLTKKNGYNVCVCRLVRSRNRAEKARPRQWSCAQSWYKGKARITDRQNKREQ